MRHRKIAAQTHCDREKMSIAKKLRLKSEVNGSKCYLSADGSSNADDAMRWGQRGNDFGAKKYDSKYSLRLAKRTELGHASV